MLKFTGSQTVGQDLVTDNYMFNRITLLYSWNYHITVSQLYLSNKIKRKKKAGMRSPTGYKPDYLSQSLLQRWWDTCHKGMSWGSSFWTQANFVHSTQYAIQISSISIADTIWKVWEALWGSVYCWDFWFNVTWNRMSMLVGLISFIHTVFLWANVCLLQSLRSDFPDLVSGIKINISMAFLKSDICLVLCKSLASFIQRILSVCLWPATRKCRGKVLRGGEAG